MLRFTCKSFRDLSLDELYDIMVLRQEVFSVEQDCVYLDADGKDQDSWHLGVSGRWISTYCDAKVIDFKITFKQGLRLK